MCNKTTEVKNEGDKEPVKDKPTIPKGDLICDDRERLERLIFAEFTPGFVQKTER